MELSVTITRFVEEYQPNIVASELMDANGHVHTFVLKEPLVSLDELNAHSSYPRPGSIRCVVLDRGYDANGRELVTISTAEPNGIESTEELSEFVVLQFQLSLPN